jgi:hypothetical protein
MIFEPTPYELGDLSAAKAVLEGSGLDYANSEKKYTLSACLGLSIYSSGG